MIKNLDAILTPLGITPDEFKKQYEAPEEHEIPLTEVEIVKKADLNTRIENIKKTERTAAVEIAVKEARTEFGLDFTGKNLKNFAEALQKKTLDEAKIAPDKKVVELTTDLEKMRGQVKDWETKYTGLESSVKTEKKQFTIDSTIKSNLPTAKNPDVKTKIPANDMALLFKTKYNPDFNDAGILVFHDDKGEILKNEKTLSPKTIDEVMAEFQTPYIADVEGGGGGKDKPGQNKPGSYEAFVKEMNGKEIVEGSKAFVDEMQLRIKSKTLTV